MKLALVLWLWLCSLLVCSVTGHLDYYRRDSFIPSGGHGFVPGFVPGGAFVPPDPANGLCSYCLQMGYQHCLKKHCNGGFGYRYGCGPGNIYGYGFGYGCGYIAVGGYLYGRGYVNTVGSYGRGLNNAFGYGYGGKKSDIYG